VTATDDAQRFLERVGPFLATEPVRNNVILTLLQSRVAHPEPGRYWSVEEDGGVAGVVFQSPRHYPAVVTPMAPTVVTAAVDAIVDEGVELPGVTGDAATAARFAGHWAERTKSAAFPVHGQRIFEVRQVAHAPAPPGAVRPAGPEDRDLLIEWFRAFAADIGDPPRDEVPLVDRRVAAGQIWVWDDGRPVAFAAFTDPVCEVVRIGPVYTPPDARRRGYATGLVTVMSAAVRDRGLRCILYTDLSNPTSNAIYRRIGYRAVEEVLRYRFQA
jgi:GNAT superfamily N-acetyltransferase